MLVNLFAIRLLSYAAGAVLLSFLLAVVAAKRKREAADWLLLVVVAGSGVWHISGAAQLYLVAVGKESASLADAFEVMRTGATLAVPLVLLHVSLLWARLNRAMVLWSCLIAYAAVATPWWLWMSSGVRTLQWVGTALLCASSAALLWAAYRSLAPYRRMFVCLAVCAAAAGATSLRGSESALLAVVSLAGPMCLLHFVYRYHVFDLLISRRFLFVFALAVVSAFYLVAVRALAQWVEAELDAFGPLVEVTLVLGAAVTWLPMYEVITRFFSRTGEVSAELSRRVIEEAARILDLGERMQYLVEQVGKTFRLRHAALVACGDPPRVAGFPPHHEALDQSRLAGLAAEIEESREDVIHTPAAPANGGFNYLFPLRYQDRLIGMLLLDTSPRRFLDENETVMLGLSRQISLSIESCRLAESKIGLEKELLRQEHLATLGKVAATIAHEVKNPLSSIKTLAQLMREDPEVLARHDRDLGYVISETDRLNSCVQQLLTFSRPLPEPTEEVGLSGLIEGVVEFLAYESAKLGVRLERRVEPELVLAHANRQTVHQVVLNLLLNGIQASPCGSEVRVEAGKEGSRRIRFRVTDHGPGIPAEAAEQVFEPFFTTKQQGTGLGLAIVRKNVRQLGGEIAVQSPVENNRGTSISILFPVE